MTFEGVGPGKEMHFQYDNSLGPQEVNWGWVNDTKAGQFNWTVGSNDMGLPEGSEMVTFCAQLFQGVSNGQTYTYFSNDIADTPDDNSEPGTMGMMRASVLGDLYARHYDSINGGMIDGFGNVGAAKASAAFQMAVWEITHENMPAGGGEIDAQTYVNSLSLKLGAFTAWTASGTTDELASFFLDSLLEGGMLAFDLMGLTNPGQQDQIMPLGMNYVPLPAPVVLAGTGLVGLLVLRRRFTR